MVVNFNGIGRGISVLEGDVFIFFCLEEGFYFFFFGLLINFLIREFLGYFVV